MKFIKKTDIEYIRKISAAKRSCSEGIAILLSENERFTSQNKILEEDDPTAHAAIVVTRSKRGLRRKGLDFELLLNQKPCPMCVSAISQANIKDFYYLEDIQIKHIELKSNIHFWYEEIHTNQKK